jgi:predicted DCC family thiol-disulfide oxidoreductase YuxK
MADEPRCTVLYDGQCPACARYIAASGLAQRADVVLLDARVHPEIVAKHDAAGLAIDDGMIVTRDGAIHFGADATRAIAELGKPETLGARFLLWFVGRAPWARALYPALAAGRRVLLRALGRPLIGRGTQSTKT